MKHDKKEKPLLDAAIEYQPDAIEIKRERLPWWARHSVLLAFLFFAGVIVWASIGKVDIVVTATGKVVTTEAPIVMQPPELAVIKDVKVKIGDVVQKDQILFTFDPTINQAELDRLKAELAALQPHFNRLDAEFGGKEYTATVNDPDSVWQEAIFQQRRKYYSEKINYFDQGINKTRASIKTRQDSLAKQTERLDAVKKIEDMYEKLEKSNAVALRELYEISITRMQMEVEVSNLTNSLVELEHEEQSLVANKNSFVEEWRKDLLEELVSIRRELLSTQKQYDKAEQIRTYEYLRAPCHAVVHEIAAYSAGSGIREAEPLVTLIPLDRVEIEAELAPKDIGKVKVGSEVRIKLNAFPFQRHGTLDGMVRTISENTFQRQGTLGTTETYYRLRITSAGKLEHVGEDFRLIPGMETQCEIKAGKRRIIEYLIYPLIKSLDESMREP